MTGPGERKVSETRCHLSAFTTVATLALGHMPMQSTFHAGFFGKLQLAGGVLR